jgi:hypothetical protein
MRSSVKSMLVLMALSLGSPSQAQMIWRQSIGPHRVLLYKAIQQRFYYCTWAIDFDGPNLSAFDFREGRPLTFRIRWKNELIHEVSEGSFLHVIVDGSDFPFLITNVNRADVMTDVVGQFGISVGNTEGSSFDVLWKKLSAAVRFFRVYLPDGKYKDAVPAEFAVAADAATRCFNEAAALNKAAANSDERPIPDKPERSRSSPDN